MKKILITGGDGRFACELRKVKTNITINVDKAAPLMLYKSISLSLRK